MKIGLQSRCRGRSGGFTLPETLIATLIVALVVTGDAAIMYMCRVQDEKNREIGIANDFGTHYLEMLRGSSFDELQPGQPVNELYDGSNGAPNIRLPKDNLWFSIDNTNYQTFHPDLIWLTNRDLAMKVE